MKTLQKLCAAALLTLILAVSALAEDGQMNCPPVAQPPSELTAEGQIGCPALLLALETVFLLS